jgi:uncharacterized protein (TIGR03437 family)
MIRRALPFTALLGAIPLLFGYTEGIDVPGEPPARRANVETLVFVVDASATPGQKNAAGETLITADSDPMAAIRNAGERWNAIADSRVNFAQFNPGASEARRDGIDVITFADNTNTRTLVGSATAVTSFFVNVSTNTIIESDVVFNPNLRDEQNNLLAFSTTGQSNTFDIEATLVHEFGHVIGAKHTSVAGATMWQNGREGELFARTLTPDDALFAIQAYPEPGALSRYGRIQGVARFENGSAIRGGLATAVNPAGTVVTALTSLSNGAYEMVVPAGNYLVYLDPANEPLAPQGLSIDSSLIDNSFATTLFGGNNSPTTVAVAAGGAATADLTAPAGAPPLEIQYVGVRDGQDILIGTGPRALPMDQNTELFLWGPGLADIIESNIRVLGPQVGLVAGSVRVSPQLQFNNFPALRLTVQPVFSASQAHPSQAFDGGSLGTILITNQGRAAAYTAGLVVEPPFPVFVAAGVANGASFIAGPVAPGELVSIFGLNLGPAAGVSTPGFGPNGLLPTVLSEVQVTFDGTPAPLLFASRGQINLQVPYEIAGKQFTSAVATYQGRSNTQVRLPVAAAAPGVFFVAANSPAILNQDFSLNTAINREARGRALIVYATGQGTVSPVLTTGQGAPGPPSLSSINVGEVTATIGGRPAQTLFAGLAPGFVGLLQINLLVPNDAPAGAQVPLAITVRGQTIQNGVTVAIAP